MLKPQEIAHRGNTMLQSYGDMLPELSYYHQINMPPAVQPPEYSLGTGAWYNSPPQSGVHSGDDYYSGRTSKTPEWSGYHHSDGEPSSYIPPTPDNSVCSSSTEGQYHPMAGVEQHHSMPMETGMMMNHIQDQASPSILANPLCSNPVAGTPEPLSVHKDGEVLPKIQSPLTNKSDENKDTMKLPGFHQTFGTITEIGRFSQHDDYFETRPDEVIEPVKVCEPVEPPPKRKPRGRKRKVVEPPPARGGGGGYHPEMEHGGEQAHHYPQWPRQHHCCQPEPPPTPPYYNHWARPQPYYPSHYSPYYHHHQSHYNDYHYPHHYPSYQPPWPRYDMIHNYHNYV